MKKINKFFSLFQVSREKYIFTKVELATVVYFVLPVFIFIVYLRNIYSLLIIPFAYFFYLMIDFKKFKPSKLTWVQLALLFIIAFLFTICVGSFINIAGSQNGDWIKHNTVLMDLTTKSWPVIYSDGASLNYYIAYYLPASFLGKFFQSFNYARVFLSIWTLIGIFLVFANLAEFTLSKKNIKIFLGLSILIFIFYSGWDWLGFQILQGNIPAFPKHLEWVIGEPIAQYSSVATLFGWVPQHGLAGALTTLMLLKNRKKGLLFFILTSFLWSSFVFLGAIVLWGILYLQNIFEEKKIIIFIRDIIVSLCIAIVFVFFFSHHQQVNAVMNWVITPEKYFVFLGVELGALAIVTLITWKYMKWEKYLVLVSFVVLFYLPMYRYGLGYNDMVMRTSIPFILLILFCCLKYLSHIKKVIVLVLCLILLLGGALTAVHEYGRVLTKDEADVGIYQKGWVESGYPEQYLGSSLK